MPFCADLRACYSNFEVNMSWVYESLRESGMELEFLSEDTRIEFELYVEKRMAQYMVWRVFHHKMDEEVKVEDYDCDGSGDVWGFVSDQVLEYHRKCPRAFKILYECQACGGSAELNDENLCEDCAKKEGITVSITLGDGEKSLAQAKEVMAKLEAVLEEKEEAATWAALTGKTAEALNILGIGSNSSASVTPIAPFVTPRRMKEQMDAACEEAKVSPVKTSYCENCEWEGEDALIHTYRRADGGDKMFLCADCLEKQEEEDAEETKEEEESFEDWAKTTTVTGIVCSLCNNELPPMTAQEHLDGKFNQTCPHKEAKASPAEEKPRMVVVAHYHISNQYRIPKGIDLHDKEQVDSWGVKWDTLEIWLKNGECIEVAPNFAINDSELKRPCETKIEEDDNQGDDDDDA